MNGVIIVQLEARRDARRADKLVKSGKRPVPRVV